MSLRSDTPPNPVELVRTAAPSSTSSTLLSPHADNGSIAGFNVRSVSFSVPLTITVGLGNLATAGVGTVPPKVSELPKRDTIIDVEDVAVEQLVVDPDWPDREGYDKDFLDVSVPLPTLSGELQANSVEVPAQYRVNDEKYVLAYHHYSFGYEP